MGGAADRPHPDPDSTLPYLLRLPLGDGLVFRTKGTSSLNRLVPGNIQAA